MISNYDKWLTTPPDNGFDSWVEALFEKMSDGFYDENEEWIDRSGGICEKWLNTLFSIDCDPERAAKLIERGFSLYRQKANEKRIKTR